MRIKERKYSFCFRDDFRINLHDSAILHALRTLGCTFLGAPTPSSFRILNMAQAVHNGAGCVTTVVVEPVSLLTSFFFQKIADVTSKDHLHKRKEKKSRQKILTVSGEER